MHLRTGLQQARIAVAAHDAPGQRVAGAPAAVDLAPLHHHLELLVDLGVLGLGARSQAVLGLRVGAVGRHHSVLMLLLRKCLRVSEHNSGAWQPEGHGRWPMGTLL